MAKRTYVRTRSLKNGMKIDQSIVDRTGRALICRGTILDEYMINSMLKMGVMGVYIGDGEDEMVGDNKKEPTIPKAVQETIEKNRVADRAKVNLTQSVKQRVHEGVQYLYDNTESEQFTSTVNSIADELMAAILENDALAVDIDALKVSDEYTFKHSVDVATMSMLLQWRWSLPKSMDCQTVRYTKLEFRDCYMMWASPKSRMTY